MLVVSDTGPLISLMKASRLDVLEALFGEVVIPVSVYEELTANNEFSEEAELIRRSSYIRVVPVDNTDSVARLQQEYLLGSGETDAIAFAFDNHAAELLIEDMLAKMAAKQLGLRTMGSVGVLVQSYKEGVLDVSEVEDAFDKMKSANRHIGEGIYRSALEYIRELEAQRTPQPSTAGATHKNM